jgi:hypothetical protein
MKVGTRPGPYEIVAPVALWSAAKARHSPR